MAVRLPVAFGQGSVDWMSKNEVIVTPTGGRDFTCHVGRLLGLNGCCSGGLGAIIQKHSHVGLSTGQKQKEKAWRPKESVSVLTITS